MVDFLCYNKGFMLRVMGFYFFCWVMKYIVWECFIEFICMCLWLGGFYFLFFFILEVDKI